MMPGKQALMVAEMWVGMGDEERHTRMMDGQMGYGPYPGDVDATALGVDVTGPGVCPVVTRTLSPVRRGTDQKAL
jgi:hypothetical protein